ncbi:MAG TPA: OmpA family protein [Rhizomicrobium sp.]|nr:OmpA family protein [Rhizomicrobium sp.]
MRKSLILLAVLMLAACAGAPRHRGGPEPAQPWERPSAQNPAPPRPGPPYVPPPVQSAGPLRTASVSAYMDGQENALRARLRGEGVIVARRGDGITLVIFDAMLFGRDDALSGNGADLLRALALILRRFDHTALQIAGYTDTTGTPAQNAEVSTRRARAVATALAADGIAPARLSAQGYGEDNPRIKTGEGVNEPRNRRIEIRISPAPMG